MTTERPPPLLASLISTMTADASVIIARLSNFTATPYELKCPTTARSAAHSPFFRRLQRLAMAYYIDRLLAISSGITVDYRIFS